ncbi:MAG: rod shape-determining protein MreC [Actinobacteria bacterium]|nr:rod shape-determining protein MreC [Actinomycetota bacterium]
MAVYRRTSRPRYTLLLLILTSITLVTLDYRSDAGGAIAKVKGGARDAFAPLQSFAAAVFDPVANVVNGVLHYGDLEAENAHLREQLAEQRGQVARAQDAERERQALLDNQDLTFLPDIETISARVVGASASSLDLTAELDKGTHDGVVRGMPVAAGAGLVGRVIEVSRRRSIVVLVTDPSSNVGIRLASTGDTGVARGNGAGRSLSVELLEGASVAKVGEVVVTSGLQQSVFPPGIPVGLVKSKGYREGPERKGVTIVPVVDFARLTFVKILIWPGAGA